ncbi:MAG TPA: nuclear transport factor 2 family protein [Solirubrobacteraceae bacterium]|nr:nuclear transport factor 2 family protein [Solirubrobacteraceae bacterium]
MEPASSRQLSEDVHDVVGRYFDLAARRNVEAIVALFTDDATVTDEGETRRGVDAIRAWLTGPVAKYEYTTTIADSEALGDDQYRVAVRLEGNFPGGTADLNYDFVIDGNRVSRLRIAP